jgi:hypothetical protein
MIITIMVTYIHIYINIYIFIVTYPTNWEKLARKELGGEIGPKELEWITPEGIRLKPLYTGYIFLYVC